VKLDFCTTEQAVGLFQHFYSQLSEEQIAEISKQSWSAITPAQVVQCMQESPTDCGQAIARAINGCGGAGSPDQEQATGDDGTLGTLVAAAAAGRRAFSQRSARQNPVTRQLGKVRVTQRQLESAMRQAMQLEQQLVVQRDRLEDVFVRQRQVITRQQQSNPTTQSRALVRGSTKRARKRK
jgi:uncharacterized membrane protein YccC